MFDYSGWVMGGVISGFKNGEISYCETTDRAERYKANGTLTQAQVEEIAMACPQPSIEPETDETVVEEPETPIEETEITDETVIEETPIEEETPIIEDGAEITEAESGGENVE